MSRSTRVLLAAFLVLLGLTATVFLGGQVAMCLGPLGVTPVQCAAATGIIPEAGLSLPFLAFAIAAATFLLAPVPADRRVPALRGGILGGVTGAVAFLALRPLTMEGPDNRGTWISIVRPLDPYALAAVVILAAVLGVLVVRVLPAIRRRRAGSTLNHPQG